MPYTPTVRMFLGKSSTDAEINMSSVDPLEIELFDLISTAEFSAQNITIIIIIPTWISGTSQLCGFIAPPHTTSVEWPICRSVSVSMRYR